jgi:hypothetical protein
MQNSLLTVNVNDILRLTTSQSVSLGIEHPPGAHDQIFIAPRLLRFCFYGAPSLTRGWVCLLYMLYIENTVPLLLRSCPLQRERVY